MDASNVLSLAQYASVSFSSAGNCGCGSTDGYVTVRQCTAWALGVQELAAEYELLYDDIEEQHNNDWRQIEWTCERNRTPHRQKYWVGCTKNQPNDLTKGAIWISRKPRTNNANDNQQHVKTD